ncbi:unnamed protein product, partial [Rotaria sordida]
EESSHCCMKLPFYRLIKSTKKCCVWYRKFYPQRCRSIEMNSSIRTQCLIEHHIFIAAGSLCCRAHISDGFLKMDLIDKIKKNRLNQCTIYRDELINLFADRNQELKNKDSKINELVSDPPLNFDDDEVPMPDKTYRVLTGLTRSQFDDLCSHIPSSTLRTTDVRTPRMAIASHSTKILQSCSSSYENSITDAQDYSDISESESDDSEDGSNILYTLA